MSYFVYLLASAPPGTLYCGVTSDLAGRVWKHKAKELGGFTAKHGVNQLVWFEIHDDINEAIAREKRIKRWRRAWKVRLIEAENPHWRDLYEKIAG